MEHAVEIITGERPQHVPGFDELKVQIVHQRTFGIHRPGMVGPHQSGSQILDRSVHVDAQPAFAAASRYFIFDVVEDDEVRRGVRV